MTHQREWYDRPGIALSIVGGVVLVVVIVVGGLRLVQPPVISEVTAEELSYTYLAHPCRAKTVYDGQRWTVTGTVIEGANGPEHSTVELAGASPGWASREKCGRTGRIFSDTITSASVTMILPPGLTLPDSGRDFRASCRIKTPGFGFYHFPLPGDSVTVVAEDCNVEPG